MTNNEWVIRAAFNWSLMAWANNADSLNLSICMYVESNESYVPLTLAAVS